MSRWCPRRSSPDGNFTNLPVSQPRNPSGAVSWAIALAEGMQPGADLLLATDPDCDRVGIAVLHEGEYHLLTGNDVGAMLLDYILAGRPERMAPCLKTPWRLRRSSPRRWLTASLPSMVAR